MKKGVSLRPNLLPFILHFALDIGHWTFCSMFDSPRPEWEGNQSRHRFDESKNTIGESSMPRVRNAVALFAMVAIWFFASPADAQMRNLIPKLFKSGETTRTAFADLVAEAGQSVVQILSDGKVSALGVVAEADGYILTKASEVSGAKVQCKLKDGKTYEAKVVGVQPVHDLMMLKIDAKDLKPVKWAGSAKPEVGSWVATVGLGSEPVAVGVVSTPRRMIAKQPGALGIQRKMLSTGEGNEDAVKEAQIGTVYPNSAAAQAGLKVDDIITQVNGKAMETFEELATTIREHGPGDVLKLRVKRGTDEFEVNVELSPMTVLPMMEDTRGSMQNRMGGKLSTRRFGFAQVIQHDTVLRPEECGGPIVNLDGEVVGLNIARAGRVESYALPADVIKPVLADLKSGKLAPVKDVAKIVPVEKKDEKVESKKEEKK